MRSAKFSKAAYMVGETNGLTENSRKKVAALLDGTGFEIVPDLTHRDISTFHNPNTNEYHIAHKGTQVGSSTMNADIAADAAFVFGMNTNHIKDRVARTEHILSAINKDATVTMSGHSLGAHSATYAMAHSPLILDRVKTFDGFNGAAHPYLNVGFNVSPTTKEI